MNRLTLFLTGLIFGVTSLAVPAANPSQAELDARCEKAREARITPEREKLINDCKAKGKDPAYCERYYSDWGAAHGANRVPMYYDIPECVAAREAKESFRQGTRPTTTREGTKPTTTRDSDPSKTKYR